MQDNPIERLTTVLQNVQSGDFNEQEVRSAVAYAISKPELRHCQETLLLTRLLETRSRGEKAPFVPTDKRTEYAQKDTR